MIKIYKNLLFLFTIVLLSCGKEFLEVKQDKSLIIPKSIKDLQALSDNSYVINFLTCNELGIIGSDDYFVSDQAWSSLSLVYDKPYERKGYYWEKDDVYEEKQVRDWDFTYKKILIANTLLEGTKKITPTQSEQAAWNNVKGSGLFIRAFAFYQLAQEFCVPYNDKTSDKDLGLPLRLNSDITAKVPRSNIAETYSQIINDLIIAADLLPDVPLINYRPSKPSTYALLARAFLQMGNYLEAGKYADLCLGIKNSLINFNQIDVNAIYSFPSKMQDNPEIIYAAYITGISILDNYKLRIDPTLYDSYADNDLGKKAYFIKETEDKFSFKGSYSGEIMQIFTGLAVDEVLLMRAECYARTSKLNLALNDLNYLLANRYTNFKKLISNNQEEILDAILDQRRKRLILRGIRWEDLRRLNKETRYRKTLVRTLNGIRYELPPEDTRYTWPIPEKAIEFGGYQQNIR